MSSKKSIKSRANVIAYSLLQGCSKDGYKRVIENALKQQREIDTNDFLEILSQAIDERNFIYGSYGYKIDRNDAIIHITNRIENYGKKREKMD